MGAVKEKKKPTVISPQPGKRESPSDLALVPKLRAAGTPVAAVSRHLLKSALFEAGSEKGGTSETRGLEVRSFQNPEL